MSSYNDSIIKAEALMTLGTIAFAQTSYEAGDGHFVAALDMLDQLAAFEELAAGAADYAERLEERGQANEAFFYMKKAYEARRKMLMDTQE
jgi:hypothetical protein